jgi:quercetin dioxygenase-like cupin family protein
MDAKLTATAPFVLGPGTGSTLNVLGVTHIYKATAAETAGSFSLWEDVVPPGAGAPPHTHAHEDEAFYVLSGEIQVEFEGESAPHRVGPGGFFFGPRHRRHAYRNVGDQPARVLVMCTPSCGLDQMFAELDAATANGMPGLETVAAIAAKFGVTIEPPAALTMANSRGANGGRPIGRGVTMKRNCTVGELLSCATDAGRRRPNCLVQGHRTKKDAAYGRSFT